MPGTTAIFGRSLAVPALCLLLLAACQSPNQAALALGAPPANIGELRAALIQRFNFPSEADAVRAAAEALQALGFAIELGSYEGGAMVGARNASMSRGGIAGRAAGQIVAGVLFGAGAAAASYTVQNTALATVTVVELPGTRTQLVRISTESLLRDNQGRVTQDGHRPSPLHADFFAQLRARQTTLPMVPRA